MRLKSRLLLIPVIVFLVTPIVFAKDEYQAAPTIAARQEEIKDKLQDYTNKAQEKVSDTKDAIQQARDDLLDSVKLRITGYIDKAVTFLDALKDRLGSDPLLTPDEQASATVEINQLIGNLNALSKKIDSSDSRENFTNVATEVRNMWEQAKDIQRKYVGLHLVARFQDYVDNMQLIANRVEIRMQALSEQGVNVSSLQSLIDDFNQSLADANDSLVQARSQFNSIIPGSGNGKALWDAGTQVLREAKQEVYLAANALRDAVLKLQNEYRDK